MVDSGGAAAIGTATLWSAGPEGSDAELVESEAITASKELTASAMPAATARAPIKHPPLPNWESTVSTLTPRLRATFATNTSASASTSA